MKVFILENAFWNLLLSSVEVYPKECLGLLIGSSDKSRIVVHHAVVFQTAERFTRGVHFPRNHIHQGVLCFLEECLTHLKIVGDFHSHTKEADYRPSEEDQEGMDEDQVYVIVQIYKKKKNLPWRYNRQKTLLAGTTRDFYFKIGAWHKRLPAESFKLAQIICPFAAGFRSEKR
ncbi:MAG: Mov34/MPN/PAD-1 family protein [Armatimonadetes bacterium]|nr:Mov34/MPN/PAD-1 family protein [Armatimonadota bacterium]